VSSNVEGIDPGWFEKDPVHRSAWARQMWLFAFKLSSEKEPQLCRHQQETSSASVDVDPFKQPF